MDNGDQEEVKGDDKVEIVMQGKAEADWYNAGEREASADLELGHGPLWA